MKALGRGHEVRGHVEGLTREGFADAAESGDHFIEYQENVVLIADFAQALQVADGGQDHSGRPGDGLDDDRSDG
jgi:hypothetical protein